MPLTSSSIVLVDNESISADGNSGVLSFRTWHWSQGIFLLNATSVATDATDTLDVFIQSAIRLPVDETGAYVWNDFIRFTQVVGNASAPVRYYAIWNGADSPETEMGAPQDQAISAGVVQGPIGPFIRVAWNWTETNDADFTISIYGTIWEDV